MTSMALRPLDEQRRLGLRRMRLLALSLLVLAGVVFLATLHRSGVWGFVNTTAEAAMVGALADWFAVTALFRHPMGLPIPHTAIIPERKDALGESLEEFVTDNFLTEPAARDRTAAADVSRRLGGWLDDEAHSVRVVNEAAAMVRRTLGAIEDAQVQEFVEASLLPRLAEEPLSPVAGHLLGTVVADGAHHGLVDLAMTEIHLWLLENQATVAGIISARAPWWSPQWLDDRVVDRVQREVRGWVADVRDDPDHRARRALDELLAELADDLQHDASTQARFEAIKVKVLTNPDIGGAVAAVWAAIRTALGAALEDPHSGLRTRAQAALRDLGRRMQRDDDLRRRVDGYAADAAAYVVRSYGREIAGVISHTVKSWDGRDAARRIELHVGRDLQFIRINGTIVGGLAGLAIHTLTVLL